MKKKDYFESVGAVHLHSDFSDGSLPIPDIAAIAAAKGLDFLLFSDHNTLAPKRQGLEGWYGPVLVITGYEINDPRDQNHYLAFRLDEEVESGLEAAAYVSEVRRRGGFGIIAHPAEKRSFSDAYPPYPWTDWDVKDYDGIEIWNQLSEWMEGITRSNFLWRIWHPLKSIRYPVWETLQRWDRINQTRRVVGVGGIDVHAFHYRILGLIPVEIYPYKVQFKSIRTHILTERLLRSGEKTVPFAEAEELLFHALKNGRAFISNYSVGDARGFRFQAEHHETVLPMGSRVQIKGPVTFSAAAPLEGRIRLIANGREILQVFGKEIRFTTKTPGVYRVEIFRKRRGWIYSNPIVLSNH